ncbi:MAG: cofactor-independent phosphoglycerate mutase [Dysgonamonadaceae bacterium]|jgi:2,3-bisphosphoglycerate-independent phosphoglycerate mutase|nr:cofactor-independent phosphoglycerate mutase [Dysgonamonadaceae bacterium]
MKYIIILGDGMADEPIESLGNLTPLQFASTPAMDLLAKKGNAGLLQTIPEGMHPGSEVANLSVLGYDPIKVLEGRGALEAASMGIDILPGEMVMRCNLICIENGKIKNHSAGHISSEEAGILIHYLNEKLVPPTLLPPGWDLGVFPGVSYRHILKLKGGNKHLDCTPPHDVPGTGFRQILIKAKTPEAQETAAYLDDLIIRSQELLENHPVNLKRKAEGKDPANSIWPWSPGYKPQMKPLAETYPVQSGAVISAVDLIKGIGIYAGLKSIDVPGATGLYDTNYEGKAQAALKALRETDFVYVHVEASDEAGHEGDVRLKVKTIEDLDKRLLKPILEAIETWDEPVTIALLPDHPTPCRLKTHTNSPVPFVIYKPGEMPDEVREYNEFSVKEGKYGLLSGDGFIKAFFF